MVIEFICSACFLEIHENYDLVADVKEREVAVIQAISDLIDKDTEIWEGLFRRFVPDR